MNIVKMSSIEPFIGNTSYKLLFNIKSEVYKCNLQECVELWKNVCDNFYVILDGWINRILRETNY